MRRYLIHHPSIATCIIWADCESDALASVRDQLGLSLPGATASPYVSPFARGLDAEIDAIDRATATPTFYTDQE